GEIGGPGRQPGRRRPITATGRPVAGGAVPHEQRLTGLDLTGIERPGSARPEGEREEHKNGEEGAPAHEPASHGHHDGEAGGLSGGGYSLIICSRRFR